MYWGKSREGHPLRPDDRCGALSVALFRNYEPEKSLQFAVAVASANAMSPSTGYFDPDVYAKLVDQVKITKIEGGSLCH